MPKPIEANKDLPTTGLDSTEKPPPLCFSADQRYYLIGLDFARGLFAVTPSEVPLNELLVQEHEEHKGDSQYLPAGWNPNPSIWFPKYVEKSISRCHLDGQLFADDIKQIQLSDEHIERLKIKGGFSLFYQEYREDGRRDVQCNLLGVYINPILGSRTLSTPANYGEISEQIDCLTDTSTVPVYRGIPYFPEPPSLTNHNTIQNNDSGTFFWPYLIMSLICLSTISAILYELYKCFRPEKKDGYYRRNQIANDTQQFPGDNKIIEMLNDNCPICLNNIRELIDSILDDNDSTYYEKIVAFFGSMFDENMGDEDRSSNIVIISTKKENESTKCEAKFYCSHCTTRLWALNMHSQRSPLTRARIKKYYTSPIIETFFRENPEEFPFHTRMSETEIDFWKSVKTAYFKSKLKEEKTQANTTPTKATSSSNNPGNTPSPPVSSASLFQAKKDSPTAKETTNTNLRRRAG